MFGQVELYTGDVCNLSFAAMISQTLTEDHYGNGRVQSEFSDVVLKGYYRVD
jgi:hypothetical protein